MILSEESRLGREAIDTAYALKQLVTAGVRVFFYLEDRERTLNTPIEKVMLSLQTMADEMEREEVRQQTYDAMSRKARAGHVTGGKCFGYDNLRVEGSHVERRINKAEAAVVRTIFERDAAGAGIVTIAKSLNADRVGAPRPQQGRPAGWASSSVHEVLRRELYRGIIVWNRTRKWNPWGQVRRSARPDGERVTVQASDVRIIDEPLWSAVVDRIQQGEARYLGANGGRLGGRPPAAGTKHLLAGLLQCGCCVSSLEAASRSHGQLREVALPASVLAVSRDRPSIGSKFMAFFASRNR